MIRYFVSYVTTGIVDEVHPDQASIDTALAERAGR